MAQASSSKRACGGGDAGADRLSALPDALAYSVMSFLTARQAVRSMPCLDIDHREFQIFPGSIAVWKRLENFTANLLMYHHAPALDRFRLRVDELPNVLVDRWVRRGISYRPAVLEITMECSHQKLKVPSLGPLPRVRRLQLCRVRLDGSFADHLRYRCPVLEELELKECDCDFEGIVSATLKRLDMEGSHRVYDNGKCPFSVTAPALATLRLAFPQCTDPIVFLVNGAELLLHASISGCQEFIGKNLFRFLGSLCNVRTLELWRFTYPHAKLTDEEKGNFPKLNNLTTLLMGECEMSKQFDILQLFLQNVTSLEKVTLEHCMYQGTNWKRATLRKISPPCRKLISMESRDLNLIEIKFRDNKTKSLFRLLMSIRRRLERNTVILLKEKEPKPITD